MGKKGGKGECIHVLRMLYKETKKVQKEGSS